MFHQDKDYHIESATSRNGPFHILLPNGFNQYLQPRLLDKSNNASRRDTAIKTNLQFKNTNGVFNALHFNLSMLHMTWQFQQKNLATWLNLVEKNFSSRKRKLFQLGNLHFLSLFLGKNSIKINI